MQKFKDALMAITEDELKELGKTELIYLQTNMESYIKLYGNDSEFNKRVNFIQGLIDEKGKTFRVDTITTHSNKGEGNENK